MSRKVKAKEGKVEGSNSSEDKHRGETSSTMVAKATN